MVVEGPFDDRVDAALQLVRGRRQLAAVLDDVGVAGREQHPVPVRPDEPEVGPAQPLVRPPPLAAPRMNGIVLGLGALLEIIAVLAMPPVEVGEPCGRLLRGLHLGEPTRGFEQRLARFALGPIRQVDARVAQHVYQAALHGDPPSIVRRPSGGLGHRRTPAIRDVPSCGAIAGRRPSSRWRTTAISRVSRHRR